MKKQKTKSIQIKQHDITDCGAACLASISSHYGLHLPISRIRQYASTDKKGTNVLGMIEAAEKLGFSAKGVKGPYESLHQIPLPAIAHVVVKEVLHHFVVIYSINKKAITIMDPADGKLRKIEHDDFEEEWTGVLILLMPEENFEQANLKTSPIKRFWNLVRPHKSIMIQALIGSALYTLLGLSSSIYIQKIVDYVLVDENQNLLNMMSIVMIIILLFQVLIGIFKQLFILRTGQKIDITLILGYYKHLLSLPQKFFDTMRVGEIISRINDAVKIRAFINDVSLELFVQLLVIVFSTALMFTYSWKLALIIFISIPLYALSYFIVNKINKANQRKLMESAADLESQLVESVTAVSTIKRFGLEPFANLKTESRFICLLRRIYLSGKTNIFAGESSRVISQFFTIILLWIGGTFVMDQILTAGELMSCYALIGYLTGPISTLINSNKTIQDALIAADRLFEIIDLEREENEQRLPLTADMLGDIRFTDVKFRYGSRVTVFENLNLSIQQGKMTAIVGESGSGKSTLVSLFQNLYKLDQGSIQIGDYDINYIDNQSLRQRVAVVPQQINLFAGNVIENIALGENEPNMKRLLDITKSLGIHDFVESLPNGYHSYIGENGTNLSGGQRQRIAIARAIYRNPDILILDEATSSLDSESEAHVQKVIQLFKIQKKTSIVIAHRLSTVMLADQILVLEKGELIEEGSHQELLDKKGGYYKLWTAQYKLAV